MAILIEISQEYEEWSNHPEINVDYFAEILERVLSRYPNFSKVKELELSILLTGDERIKSLNNEFRGKNKATNILSFPDIEIDWQRIVEFEVDKNYMYLGDIASSYQTIKHEATLKSIGFQDHFKHLVIHAILHLIGYDHMNEEESKAMENIEIEVLDSFGIDSPY